MNRRIRNFLQDEERASRILITAAVVIMAVSFVIAVLAILLMK